MHSIQLRVGALFVVTGFTLAFTLRAGWAMFIGPSLLVAGGLVLALAVEPLVDGTVSTAEDATDTADPQGEVAA